VYVAKKAEKKKQRLDKLAHNFVTNSIIAVTDHVIWRIIHVTMVNVHISVWQAAEQVLW